MKEEYEKWWWRRNEQALRHRLAHLGQLPDGEVFSASTPLHNLLVHKEGSQLQLLFRDPTATDVMSRLDLRDPLRLVAAYTQALMLSLVWVEEPAKVYVLGFGGGRIPLLLHHYFPEIGIEASELDPAVVDLACRFFGVQLDSRLKVVIEEGRQYLANRPNARNSYDLIMVDAFRGTGYSPYRLATTEFYRLCQSRLTRGGVVLVNLLDSDPLYQAKILTFSRAFSASYSCFYQDSTVLIGTSLPYLTDFEILERAQRLEEQYDFHFPLARVAEQGVLSAEAHEDYLDQLESEQTPLLSDSEIPPGYFESLDPASTIFAKARQDNLCPCQSGRKFRQCHGRGQ